MNVQILTLAVIFLIFIIIILFFIYLKMSINEKNKDEQKSKEIKNTNEKKEKSKYKSYDEKSISDFMEFEEIEDNMIIQKRGKRFLMVIECQGVNYDLMSEIERTGVETGFLQFLNSLREPIQIYTQTRTVNLEKSIQDYKTKLGTIEKELNNAENKYKQAIQSGNTDEKTLNNLKIAVAKERNLYDYGKDVIFNTERMSLNKNVLSKKYYVIIPYYYQDTEEEYFDKTEIRNIAFSELYTKSQSIIRVLSACGVVGKILDSYDLVDMLYNAYNRDEAETYGIEKAVKAGMDELYITAPNVLDKKMEALDTEIEKKAVEIAKNALNEVRMQGQEKVLAKEKNLEQLAAEMAETIIQENEQNLGKEVAKKAVEKIKKKSKGGETDEKK